MIPVKDFWRLLKENDYKFFSGVPCSILTNILNYPSTDIEIRYIPAVRENNALGVVSGAYFRGVKGGILIQNSGLGNIINTLTSFNLMYKIPVLMFITWRGYQGKDAPEHIIMGKKTLKLLEELGIPTVTLSENYKEEILWAMKESETSSIPVAVIIKKGIIE